MRTGWAFRWGEKQQWVKSPCAGSGSICKRSFCLVLCPVVRPGAAGCCGMDPRCPAMRSPGGTGLMHAHQPLPGHCWVRLSHFYKIHFSQVNNCALGGKGRDLPGLVLSQPCWHRAPRGRGCTGLCPRGSQSCGVRHHACLQSALSCFGKISAFFFWRIQTALAKLRLP